jgi:signal peptidase I
MSDHSIQLVRSYNSYEVDNIVNPNRLAKIHKFLIYFIIVFTSFSLVYGFFKWGITETLKVEGASMQPTFINEDRITVEKFWSKTGGFKRGDNVVFYQGNRLIVKRVIGLSGEIIEIKNKKVYVYNNTYPQGAELKENYLSTGIDGKNVPTCKIPDCSVENDKTLIKDKQLFLMGDNREFSSDSRIFGTVKTDQILGTVFLVNSNGKQSFVKEADYNISKY